MSGVLFSSPRQPVGFIVLFLRARLLLLWCVCVCVMATATDANWDVQGTSHDARHNNKEQQQQGTIHSFIDSFLDSLTRSTQRVSLNHHHHHHHHYVERHLPKVLAFTSMATDWSGLRDSVGNLCRSTSLSIPSCHQGTDRTTRRVDTSHYGAV